uniref:Uncharacterized protein n=1 Tax=Tetraselmis sp. GSL018 TaxID=582737 RepID=A0A061QT98_9CHLO
MNSRELAGQQRLSSLFGSELSQRLMRLYMEENSDSENPKFCECGNISGTRQCLFLWTEA